MSKKTPEDEKKMILPVQFDPERYRELQKAALTAGMSMNSFVRQAVFEKLDAGVKS